MQIMQRLHAQIEINCWRLWIICFDGLNQDSGFGKPTLVVIWVALFTASLQTFPHPQKHNKQNQVVSSGIKHYSLVQNPSWNLMEFEYISSYIFIYPIYPRFPGWFSDAFSLRLTRHKNIRYGSKCSMYDFVDSTKTCVTFQSWHVCNIFHSNELEHSNILRYPECPCSPSTSTCSITGSCKSWKNQNETYQKQTRHHINVTLDANSTWFNMCCNSAPSTKHEGNCTVKRFKGRRSILADLPIRTPKAPWSVKLCEHLWNTHGCELCEVPPLDAAKVNFDDRSAT